MRTRCAIEKCNKYSHMGCSGHCGDHSTQKQRDERNRKKGDMEEVKLGNSSAGT